MRIVCEVGKGAARTATDTSSYLMQLCKTETIRVFNYQRVGVRNVNARFDYRCADKNVNFALKQLPPDLAELLLAHFSVAYSYPRVRQTLLELCGGAVNRFRSVVQVIHLSAAAQLALNRLADKLGIVRYDIGLNRMTIRRGHFKHRHIAYSRHCHVESARNRRCGKGEYINKRKLFLELFLLRNTEALLLVNNKQTEILKFNAARNY